MGNRSHKSFDFLLDPIVYFLLLYNLKNRPIFIGLEPPRDQSIDCHMYTLASACLPVYISY